MKSSISKIIIAKPRSFCAGVKRALDIVDRVIEKHHSIPIYIRHHIIHNKYIIRELEKKRIVFVEDIDVLPDNSVLIISAHGCGPKIYKRAKEKNLILYDATCPLVTKVHFEAIKYAKIGFSIIYIGNKNHPEAIGVRDEVSQKVLHIISDHDDIGKLPLSKEEKIIILTQTTFSFDDSKALVFDIKKRFPKAILPPVFDVCYSTQNRQNAVKQLIGQVGLILVIGSKESSNSNRLQKIGKDNNVPTYLIDDESEIDKKWFKNINTVGVTSGASTPEELVQKVVKFLANENTEIEEIGFDEQIMSFKLPVNI